MMYYCDYIKSREFNNLKYGDIGTITLYDDKNISKTYSKLTISFDIETSLVYALNEPYTFMYIWQMGINHEAVYGRTWDELEYFLIHFNNNIIKTHQYTRDANGKRHKCKVHFFGFIHNIAYEWAFCKGNMQNLIEDVFLKEKRQPLFFKMCNILFLDSYQITRKSLAELAKDYCKTQKLVGDLDYSIERNQYTKMSDIELGYCENDVIILNEYQEYYIAEYLENGIKTLVYTQTGIVRAKLKQDFAKQNTISKDNIGNMFPNSRIVYDMHMKYLFRGGYVHGDASYYNTDITNVDSFDITSAHPFQCVSKAYPMSHFKKIDADFITPFLKLDNKYAYIIDCEFKNLRAKANHSIESLSKCISIKGGVIDNGRVHSADTIRVMLTEIDYEIYTWFYSWDLIHVISIEKADKAELPQYVVKNIISAYEIKEKMKLMGKQYFNEKVFLNSIFGSFVTRIYAYQYRYKNGKIIKINTDYKREVSKRILSMYWGVWTTAYTRHQQLYLLKQLNALYGDTDSVKSKHNNKNKIIVDNINKDNSKILKYLATRYKADYTLIKEFGQWDYEGCYEHFKMLGAKRYAYIKDGKTHITCAGLPKKSKVAYDDFKNELCVANCKLTTIYNDTSYTAYVDSVKMQSRGGVSLVPCDFTVNVSKEYINFVEWILQQRIK